MGLAQKRALQKLKEDVYPKHKAALDAAVGKDVEFAVHWDSYNEQDLSVIENALEVYGLAQIPRAFELVCKDDLGKGAVQEAVKKVELFSIAGSDDNALQFSDGVLKVGLGDPSYTGYWSSDRIAEFLEEKL